MKRGVLYSRAEAEGTRRRNPYDTIVEGVGLNRLTANFAAAEVDDAVQGSDQETVSMVHHHPMLYVSFQWVQGLQF